MAEERRPMSRETNSKQKIERAALTLFVARGVASTTTKEIAMAAGIAEGTIYRYFVGKDELAYEMFVEHHVRLAVALEAAHRPHAALRDKLPAIVRCYCEMADEDWLLFSYHLLAMHLLLSRVPDDKPNPVNVVRDVVRDGMAKGEIPARDHELITAAALGVILQPAIHKVYGQLDCRLSDHIELFTAAIWRLITTH
jgi:AcrR family transcriptional regulator